jgi:hypothetical protein
MATVHLKFCHPSPWIWILSALVVATAFASRELIAAEANLAEIVRQVLVAAYPQLNTADTSVRITQGPLPINDVFRAGQLNATVTGREAPQGPAARTVLNVSVYFDPDQNVTEFRSSGSLVSTEHLLAFRAEVDRHRNWSDDDVLRALRAAGARYGPDQMNAPEKFFGARVRNLGVILGPVTLRNIEFEIRDLDQFAAELHAARIVWKADIDVSAPIGKPSRFLVEFEPFEGELIWVASHR